MKRWVWGGVMHEEGGIVHTEGLGEGLRSEGVSPQDGFGSKFLFRTSAFLFRSTSDILDWKHAVT